MLRLLCITAHPDDEAGSFGGSLLMARERGAETFVICLTPGQAATHRGGAASDDELAEMRRHEFQLACEHLNVSQGTVLDYPDGKLDKVNFYDVVADVTARIRTIRPQIVLTFGPEGAITAHPDHSMVSLITTAAVQWASRSNRFTDQFYEGLKPHQVQKLYYSTTNFTLPERQPVSLSPATAVIDIGSQRVDRKIEAFCKHKSQQPLFSLLEEHVRRRGQLERFHLVANAKPGDVTIETDLWSDVDDVTPAAVTV